MANTYCFLYNNNNNNNNNKIHVKYTGQPDPTCNLIDPNHFLTCNPIDSTQT